MSLYTNLEFETMPDIDRGCPFCSIPTERVIAHNELSYAMRDGFPVTHLHTLVIPKRHVEDCFALAREEIFACDALLRHERETFIGKSIGARLQYHLSPEALNRFFFPVVARTEEEFLKPFERGDLSRDWHCLHSSIEKGIAADYVAYRKHQDAKHYTQFFRSF